jgi:hypothetical protein
MIEDAQVVFHIRRGCPICLYLKTLAHLWLQSPCCLYKWPAFISLLWSSFTIISVRCKTTLDLCSVFSTISPWTAPWSWMKIHKESTKLPYINCLMVPLSEPCLHWLWLYAQQRNHFRRDIVRHRKWLQALIEGWLRSEMGQCFQL